jgi:Flp pilus assembly pilin Flp
MPRSRERQLGVLDARSGGLGIPDMKRRDNMKRKALETGKALLLDESGQTMLEYAVIVVFVVIVMFIAFRLVKGSVHRSVQKASASIEA